MDDQGKQRYRNLVLAVEAGKQARITASLDVMPGLAPGVDVEWSQPQCWCKKGAAGSLKAFLAGAVT